MWLTLKLNGTLKDRIVTWFLTGKLSPWRIFTDLMRQADLALAAKGYKPLSELKQESQKIADTMDSVEGSVPPNQKENPLPRPQREKPKPHERDRHGRLI